MPALARGLATCHQRARLLTCAWLRGQQQEPPAGALWRLVGAKRGLLAADQRGGCKRGPGKGASEGLEARAQGPQRQSCRL